MSLVKCPSCGTSNDPDQTAGYCDECGKKLPGLYVPSRTTSRDAVDPGSVLEVTCPRCGKKTDRIQVYDVPVVLIALVYVVWTTERVFGCPKCVPVRPGQAHAPEHPSNERVLLDVRPLAPRPDYIQLPHGSARDTPGIRAASGDRAGKRPSFHMARDGRGPNAPACCRAIHPRGHSCLRSLRIAKSIRGLRSDEPNKSLHLTGPALRRFVVYWPSSRPGR